METFQSLLAVTERILKGEVLPSPLQFVIIQSSCYHVLRFSKFLDFSQLR